MSALSEGARRPVAPLLKEANRGGGRSATGRSASGPLRSRRLHVQFNVVKSGPLEGALVAPIPVN